MTEVRRLGDAIRSFEGSLQTARLRLRLMDVTDAAALFPLFDDFEVVRWLAQPDWPQDYTIFAESLGHIVDEQRSGEAVHFVILHNEKPVGGIALVNYKDQPIIGYWLGRAFWNTGYMTEAVSAVCDWIFKETDVVTVHSGVFAGNDASLRVQAKLGFQICGRSRVTCRPLGQMCDHIDTRLDRKPD